MKVEPGQIWLSDKDFIYNQGYDGEIAYLIKSKEPDEDWVCICFQNWEFGGYERMLDEESINKMKFIGHIKNLSENVCPNCATEYGAMGECNCEG